MKAGTLITCFPCDITPQTEPGTGIQETFIGGEGHVLRANGISTQNKKNGIQKKMWYSEKCYRRHCL